MIRKLWKTLLFTSIVILLPMLVGIILWNQLPEQIPVHWNAAGEVDGWAGKAFAVFGLSGLMLALHWLCVLGTAADPKKANHSDKVLHLVLWVTPVLSVVLFSITYATALGHALPIERILPALLGLVFAIIGNYLPKCKQNYTIGIKIPWTLNSEENWNRTHRFAGRVFMVCGLMILFTAFFGGFWVFGAVSLVMVLAPIIYSYALHRKGI